MADEVRPVVFCARCCISNQRPVSSREYARAAGSEPHRMAFDTEGVCEACRVAERKRSIDWAERAAELECLLARYRRSNGRRPDVLVPGSGGKDSFYAAHKLKYEYGMHPLLVTWAPHAYTEVGLRNLRAWQEGFDHILVTPNPVIHRLLTRLAFLNLLHPFQPFVLGQRSLAPLMAVRYEIPLVFFGEDDAEYEGSEGWQTKKETTTPETAYLSGVPYRELLHEHKLDPADLSIYLPPSAPQAAGIHVAALGYYLPWQPQAAYYFAAERGFEANDERTEGTYSKYNSIDDRLDPMHYFTTWIKFGLGRASYDAAQEIRNGHLTREEGVGLVRQYDGEVRDATVAWACAYMGLMIPAFWRAINEARAARPWLWAETGDGWRLRQTVFAHG